MIGFESAALPSRTVRAAIVCATNGELAEVIRGVLSKIHHKFLTKKIDITVLAVTIAVNLTAVCGTL